MHLLRPKNHLTFTPIFAKLGRFLLSLGIWETKWHWYPTEKGGVFNPSHLSQPRSNDIASALCTGITINLSKSSMKFEFYFTTSICWPISQWLSHGVTIISHFSHIIDVLKHLLVPFNFLLRELKRVQNVFAKALLQKEMQLGFYVHC